MKSDKKMEFKHAMAMKKAGLPKKMVAEEMSEATKKYAAGGTVRGTGAAQRGTNFGGMTGLKKGGKC